MTKSSSLTLTKIVKNWQNMSDDDCLLFLSDVLSYATDELEALDILQRLFAEEMVATRDDDSVMQALADAVAQLTPKAVQIIEESSADLDNDKIKPKRRSKSKKQATDTADDTAIVNDPAQNDTDKKQPRKKPATRKAKAAQADRLSEDYTEHGTDINNDTDIKKPDSKTQKTAQTDDKAGLGFVQEAVLEFVEEATGEMVLREVGASDALVRIEFSDQVKSMLGVDMQMVGQAMIHAAIASVVQRQANFWHAHIYDEEPTHYS